VRGAVFEKVTVNGAAIKESDVNRNEFVDGVSVRP
jgi:hypothetical protein